MHRSLGHLKFARLVVGLVALGAASHAASQELPPALEMPPVDAEAVAPPPPMSDGLATVGDAEPFRPLAAIDVPAEELWLHQHLPAPTESSGTWLRRGLWFADLEGVVMTRTWNNNNFTLVGENELPGIGSGGLITVGTGNPAGVEGEIGESSAGWDGLPRLTLGRFLFRDIKNRDHTAEFVASGGAEWNDAVSVEATTPSALFVPDSIDQDRISFEGATASEFEYSSRFYNFEWNYQVTERMAKDRMELQPGGDWIRRASPGFTRHYIAGLRYFDLEENVNWSATGINTLGSTAVSPPTTPFAADSGNYRVLATNNLFGPQLGVGITYEANRWNVSLSGKFGGLVNDARATGNLSFVNPTTADTDFTTDVHENTLSYFSQWNLTARYHLRPNLSLRIGWEGLYVTAVALAPNNLTFDPAARSISVTGDVFYNGLTMGTEYFW